MRVAVVAGTVDPFDLEVALGAPALVAHLEASDVLGASVSDVALPLDELTKGVAVDDVRSVETTAQKGDSESLNLMDPPNTLGCRRDRCTVLRRSRPTPRGHICTPLTTVWEPRATESTELRSV